MQTCKFVTPYVCFSRQLSELPAGLCFADRAENWNVFPLICLVADSPPPPPPPHTHRLTHTRTHAMDVVTFPRKRKTNSARKTWRYVYPLHACTFSTFAYQFSWNRTRATNLMIVPKILLNLYVFLQKYPTTRRASLKHPVILLSNNL